jgi:hypothetical protein
MASPLSPIRIARIVNTAVPVSSEESIEVDFDLAVEEGVELYVVEFSADELLPDPGADELNAGVSMSLHVETGTIETQNPTVDGQILNSEIVAETQFIAQASSTAGSVESAWSAYPSARHNFLEMHGRPLLIAQNPTFVIDTDAIAIVANGFCRIWYRYVKLTRDELVNQFLLRR